MFSSFYSPDQEQTLAFNAYQIKYKLPTGHPGPSTILFIPRITHQSSLHHTNLSPLLLAPRGSYTQALPCPTQILHLHESLPGYSNTVAWDTRVWTWLKHLLPLWPWATSFVSQYLLWGPDGTQQAKDLKLYWHSVSNLKIALPAHGHVLSEFPCGVYLFYNLTTNYISSLFAHCLSPQLNYFFCILCCVPHIPKFN